jgi:hypothetical protein
MRTVPCLLRALGVPLLAGCIIFPAATGALAQDANAPRKPITVQPSDADAAAGRDAEVVFRKAWTGARARTMPESKLMVRGTSARAEAGSGDSEHGDDFVRIPGRLSFLGGHVVEFAESHDIYLLPAGTSVASNWGDPETFLRDLGKSEFIHVTDQYTGETANKRYTLGGSVKIPFTVSTTPLIDAQIRGLLHAVTTATNETGYNHIYHVFLPPGQDECFDSTFSVCASNVFCAYHGSVTFKDTGRHVLYSVEPFTNVIGCQVRPDTSPNGLLIDSTNNVLSHELIETITDPDGLSWVDITSGGMFGQEIGDECVFVVFLGGNVFTGTPFTDPAIISVDGRKYALQPEYNNRAQACTAER